MTSVRLMSTRLMLRNDACRDYEAIVQDFVTLDFIPPGTDLRPILPVLAKVTLAAAVCTSTPITSWTPSAHCTKKCKAADARACCPHLLQVFDQALEGGGAKNINFQELAADLAQITFDYP
jgi:aarF domain-containing kinase